MSRQLSLMCRFLFLLSLVFFFKPPFAQAELGDGELNSFEEYDFTKNEIKTGSLGLLQGLEISYRHGKQSHGGHCAEVLNFTWKGEKQKKAYDQTLFNEMTDCSKDPFIKNDQIQWEAEYARAPIWHCWSFNHAKTKLIACRHRDP